MQVEKLAPGMLPASRLVNRARAIELSETGIAIGLQRPGEAFEMGSGVLAFAIRRVAKPGRRRCATWRNVPTYDLSTYTASG